MSDEILSELDNMELGRQLMKPSGEAGLKVADNMNSTNNQIYNFVLSQLNIDSGCNILEIGFGNGKLLKRYFEINPVIKLSAIDFSVTMCTEAVRVNEKLISEGKLKIKCEDSSNTSFYDNVFDKVVTINTIYFWEKIEEHLQEVKRILKNGGQLFIGYRPKSALINLPFTKEVFKFYSSEDLQLIVKQNGFKVVSEKSQITDIKAVDGSAVQSLDLCLIAQKL